MIGTTPIESEPTPSITEQALSYLQEKYAEEFTYAAPWGSSMSGSREFLATCSSLPGQTILVRIADFDSDDKTFSDNYLAVKYQQDTIRYFEDRACEFFTEARAFHEAGTNSLSAVLGAGTALDDYLMDASTEITIMVEVKASTVRSADQVQAMIDTLPMTSGKIMLTLVAVDDELYGTLDRSGLNILMSRGEDYYSLYVEISDGAARIDWPGED